SGPRSPPPRIRPELTPRPDRSPCGRGFHWRPIATCAAAWPAVLRPRDVPRERWLADYRESFATSGARGAIPLWPAAPRPLRKRDSDAPRVPYRRDCTPEEKSPLHARSRRRSRCGFPTEFPAQPSADDFPFTFHGALGNPQHFGDFLHG